MILNVLAVGDVVGDGGLDYLGQHLRALKKLKNIHFTVVNGENASGVGILPRQARAIFDAGADVVTLGNHTWNRIQIADFLEDDRYTLRPANYTSRVPGRGWGVYDGPGGVRIGVMNLIGRCEMDSNFDNPFTTADGQILPKGLGFVTDLGMTGPAESVLGIRPEQAVNRFLGGLPRRFEPAPGPCKLESVLFSIDTDQRRCVSVERVDIRA